MVSSLKRLISVGKQTQNVFILIAFYVIIGILSIVTSATVGFITQGSLAFDTSYMKQSILILVLASSFEILLTWISNIRKATMREAMLVEFKKETAQAILDAEFEYSQSLEKGDIIGRLNNDVSSIATASEMAITIIRSTILLMIILVGMAYFDLRLLLSFLSTIPLYFITEWWIVSKSTGLIIPWKNAMGETNALIQELLSNRSTIKAYTLKPVALDWLKVVLNNSASKGIKGIGLLYAFNLLQFALMYAPTYIIAIVGVYLVSQGSLNVSVLVSTFLLSQIAFDALGTISNSAQNIPQLLASTQRIFPIWDTPKEHSGLTKEHDIASSTIIEFENVSFAYPSAPDVSILNNLTLTIHAGENVGLVGTSGSGKSTLFKLMSGLYHPTSGSIKIYGVDVNQWDKQALRDKLSVISQNTFLFEDTIFNNLKYADQDLTHEKALDVLQAANLSKFIETSTDGLNTNIGEKGAKLSGGQRQRLSIARSMIKDAPIILYDEATSALDAESEKEIDRLVMEHDTSKTQIVIAHRFSTIKGMDRILVLDKGKVVEEGTHASLVQSESLYKTLYEKQGGSSHESHIRHS